MQRQGAGALAVCLTALALTVTLTPPSRADLLVLQGIEELASYRICLEGQAGWTFAELEASLVLFFPPLSPPPDNQPDAEVLPPDPRDPPIDPEPPNHYPEPTSLVAGALGGSLLCFFGWWRRK